MIKTGVRVPPPEEKECEWCGGAFLSLAHRPKRFCSRKCVGAHGHSKRKARYAEILAAKGVFA